MGDMIKKSAAAIGRNIHLRPSPGLLSVSHTVWRENIKAFGTLIYENASFDLMLYQYVQFIN